MNFCCLICTVFHFQLPSRIFDYFNYFNYFNCLLGHLQASFSNHLYLVLVNHHSIVFYILFNIRVLWPFDKQPIFHNILKMYCTLVRTIFSFLPEQKKSDNYLLWKSKREKCYIKSKKFYLLCFMGFFIIIYYYN